MCIYIYIYICICVYIYRVMCEEAADLDVERALGAILARLGGVRPDPRVYV